MSEDYFYYLNAIKYNAKDLNFLTVLKYCVEDNVKDEEERKKLLDLIKKEIKQTGE